MDVLFPCSKMLTPTHFWIHLNDFCFWLFHHCFSPAMRMNTQPAAQDQQTCPCRSEFHTLSNYSPPTPMQDYNRHLQHLPSLCITFHIATAFLSHRLLRTCSRMQMQREAADQSFLQAVLSCDMPRRNIPLP